MTTEIADRKGRGIEAAALHAVTGAPDAYPLHGGQVRDAPSMGNWQTACAIGAVSGAVLLLVFTALFLYWSRSWPLVNDSALMHYVVLLMQRGMAPYREIGDINLPGAYVPEWLSSSLASGLHVPAAAMWRVMDAMALLLTGAAMMKIARPYSWFAGVFAGCLFSLYHGRDGIGQAGQRDLWVAMLLVWAAAALFAAMRASSAAIQQWQLFCFGLCVSASATIKPFGFAFLLCLAPLLARQRRGRIRVLINVAAGAALPLVACLLFLWRWHAGAAMWQVLRMALPYHASLAAGAWWQLLGASSVPSVLKFLGLLLLTSVFAGGWRLSWSRLWRGADQRCHEGAAVAGWAVAPERLLLAFCVLLGLLSFVLQGKGYSYQRYPYVAFLLLLLSLEFTAAVQSQRRWSRAAGVAGLVFGVLLCAPSYLREAKAAHWAIPVSAGIERSIQAQAPAGDIRSLEGEVQCLDVVSGCTDALLHLGLREATGTMYDEFLFPQAPSRWGNVYRGPPAGMPLPAAVAAGQQHFQQALLHHAPRVFVVSAWLFPEGPGNYSKLQLWPWFSAFLADRYTLVSQQQFHRAENGPLGFRVYVLQAHPQ